MTIRGSGVVSFLSIFAVIDLCCWTGQPLWRSVHHPRRCVLERRLRSVHSLPAKRGRMPTQDHLWIDWDSDPNGKTSYATVLARQMAGKKLAFGVSGCSSTGIPLVYRVDIVE